jgi:hypothetical protein
MSLVRLSLLLCSLLCSVPVVASSHPAQADIQRIVDRFQEALVAKDGATLRGLFLPHNASWLGVATDAQVQRWRSRGLDDPRVEPGSYTRFIDRVVAQPERIEEKFSDVKIHTDGAIASVHFAFVFLKNGRAVNRGEEAWHLVNTDAGWKISSVIFTVERPD